MERDAEADDDGAVEQEVKGIEVACPSGEVDAARRPRLDEQEPHPPVRLVALDMDGTLLDPGPSLRPEVGEILRRVQAGGVAVVLATGRMWRSAAAWAERIGLRAPIVAYNGALVRGFPGGATWQHRPLPLEAARAVAEACREAGWFLQSYVEDRLYIPAADPRADEYCRVAGVEAHVDPDVVWRPERRPTKMLVIEKPEAMPDIVAHLSESAAGRLELANSFPHYLEVEPLGVSKAAGLRSVSRRLGIPRHSMLAVGDGGNDVAMVSYVGVGVAVANAAPEVKAAADHVTENSFGLGVAEAIERFVGA